MFAGTVAERTAPGTRQDVEEQCWSPLLQLIDGMELQCVVENSGGGCSDFTF